MMLIFTDKNVITFTVPHPSNKLPIFYAIRPYSYLPLPGPL